MGKSGLIVSILVVVVVTGIICYEIKRKYTDYADEQKNAFGSLGKTGVVKTITDKWKTKIFASTKNWIITSPNALGWKMQITEASNKKGITFDEAANEAIKYLWDNNVLRMFDENWKNIEGDKWKFYWNVGELNKLGLKNLSGNNKLLIEAISKVQNQPSV